MANAEPQESQQATTLISAALALHAASREMANEPKQYGSFYEFDVKDQSHMWSQTWRNAIDDGTAIARNGMSIDEAELKPAFKKMAAAIRNIHRLLPSADSIEAQEVSAALDIVLSERLYQWDANLHREERNNGAVRHFFRAKYRPIDAQVINVFIDAVRRLGVGPDDETTAHVTRLNTTGSRSKENGAKKPKRSTERDEARTKLIAALTLHHKYADGSCLNWEPVGSNALARLANASQATASRFFTNQFEGHAKYQAMCRDKMRLVTALKLLNNEFAPHVLATNEPTDDGEHDDGK